MGGKPHVGEIQKPDTLTVNEFIYCKPGTLDHTEGFEELLAEGVIAEYAVFKAQGATFGAIAGSGDRVAYFSIVAPNEEELKRRHALANQRIKAVSTDGVDLIRHDLIAKYQ